MKGKNQEGKASSRLLLRLSLLFFFEGNITLACLNVIGDPFEALQMQVQVHSILDRPVIALSLIHHETRRLGPIHPPGFEKEASEETTIVPEEIVFMGIVCLCQDGKPRTMSLVLSDWCVWINEFSFKYYFLLLISHWGEFIIFILSWSFFMPSNGCCTKQVEREPETCKAFLHVRLIADSLFM